MPSGINFLHRWEQGEHGGNEDKEFPDIPLEYPVFQSENCGRLSVEYHEIDLREDVGTWRIHGSPYLCDVKCCEYTDRMKAWKKLAMEETGSKPSFPINEASINNT